MIDRKDLENYTAFPVWKIDTGRLLQKFEPTDRDGQLVHQSLSTVSWNQPTGTANSLASITLYSKFESTTGKAN